MNRTINDCMNWTANLTTVAAIALTAGAVVKAAMEWKTAKIHRDKARLDSDKAFVELYMMLKKAGQDIAASSATSHRSALLPHIHRCAYCIHNWFHVFVYIVGYPYSYYFCSSLDRQSDKQ
jgi:hypothetical protein